MIERHLINLALAFVYWMDDLALRAGDRLKAMRERHKTNAWRRRARAWRR